MKKQEVSLENKKQKMAVLDQVRELLGQLNSDYIVVVEGASICSIKKDGIIRDLRKKLKDYEISIGEDPNHDWRK